MKLKSYFIVLPTLYLPNPLYLTEVYKEDIKRAILINFSTYIALCYTFRACLWDFWVDPLLKLRKSSKYHSFYLQVVIYFLFRVDWKRTYQVQKGEFQNGGNKKAKQVKFSEKWTFLTHWYAQCSEVRWTSEVNKIMESKSIFSYKMHATVLG